MFRGEAVRRAYGQYFKSRCIILVARTKRATTWRTHKLHHALLVMCALTFTAGQTAPGESFTTTVAVENTVGNKSLARYRHTRRYAEVAL